MLSELKALTTLLKKLIEQYPEEQKSISFLIASGLAHQGTSTILKQAGLHHIHTEEQLNIDVFYNQQGIILELNQSFTENTQSLQQVFKYLNRCHRKLRVSGFLFCLDLADLLRSDPEEQTRAYQAHAQHIQKFIRALEYQVRTGIVVTKLDQISGFTDFFQLAHHLELQEALGFSVNHSQEEQKFSKIFSDSWSNFVAHLNQLMIQKVHTTRANKSRLLIREFPLQIALLESRFLSLFKQLADERFLVHGIYFTSAEQKGRNINFLNQKIQNDFSLMVPISAVQSTNHKPYFVLGAIKHNQDLSSYTPSPKTLDDRNLQISIGATIVLSCYLVFQTIKTHQVIQHAQTQFMQTQHTPASLENLNIALQRLEKLPILFGHIPAIQLFKNQVFNLEKNQYNKQIAHSIMAQLKQGLMHTELNKSFAALKVYKAIAQGRHDQTQFILNWFQANANPKLNLVQQALLKKFLWEINWPLPQESMQNTQNILASLEPDYLAYHIIATKLAQSVVQMPSPGFEQAEIHIPKAYTKAGFKTTVKEINRQLELLKQDDWVLGGLASAEIKTKVQEQYAKKYVLWWRNLEHSLRPQRCNSFTDAQNLMQALSEHQTLSKLLQRMIDETQPNLNQTENLFNQMIASQFTDLHLMSHDQSNIDNLLKESKKFLKMLTVFNENGQVSFQYLRSYFNQIQFNDALYHLNEYAKRSPQPLQTWINQIKDEIWVLILQSGKNYLNQKWNMEIYQPYLQTMQGKYPFFNSDQEISLSEFAAFFGSNGHLQRFFREYLQAFVDQSDAQWKAKEMEHKRLPIDEDVIQKLMQANIISTMFFPNHNQEIEVLFSLEKMSLDPVVAKLRLTIGEQEISDHQDESLIVDNLKWPAQGAKLWIKTLDGKEFNLSENGQWGFFRLLEQTNVLNDVNEPANLQVMFEINGNSGRYQIKTNQAINPFLPSMLKQFELKDKVFN